jgi:hypothetical protein
MNAFRNGVLVCALAVPATGCVHSGVDAAWGTALPHVTAAQTASPLGIDPSEPKFGLDAPTSERVADRYYRGQEAQTTRQATTILIGE